MSFPVQIQMIFPWKNGRHDYSLVTEFPKGIRNCIDTHVGRGTTVIALARAVRHQTIQLSGKIVATDPCFDLIHFYKTIQKMPFLVWCIFDEIQEIMEQCTDGPALTPDLATCRSSRSTYFYWIRNELNRFSVEDERRSAYFLFIVRNCFREYRRGPHGCNCSFGRKAKRLHEDDFRTFQDAIRGVEFHYSLTHIPLEQDDWVH